MSGTATFHLPDAGEGLTEADIVRWLVAPGDAVAINQPVVEVETAKALVELPSPWAGVVSELLVEAGETVAVGTPILVVTTDSPAGDAAVAEPAPAETPAAEPAPATGDGSSWPVWPDPAAHNGDPATGDGSYWPDPAEGSITPVEPETPAVLVGYGVQEPPASRRHQLETDPAPGPSMPGTADVRSGGRVVLPAGGDRQDDAQLAASAGPAGFRFGGYGTPGSDSTTGPGAGGQATPTPGAQPVLAKPPVRQLARELGIDLATVRPSGPGGIVTREDVLAAQEQQAAQRLATYPGDDQPWLVGGVVSRDGRMTRVPIRSVRRRTAEATVASAFTAPHVNVFHTLDVTKTMKLVETLRQDRDFADVHVTPLLIAAKALLLAVQRHPEINASWDETAREIVYKHYVNLGIAASTPRGLVVPNIKDAHRMRLHDLGLALGDLTRRARAGQSSPADLSDGTITITNVGIFGIDTGTPILNPGEAAILALGAITKRPWVRGNRVTSRWVTQLALSFDHRLVDGGLGSTVLSDVARVLADPAQALVWG